MVSETIYSIIIFFLDPIYCPALSVQYGNVNVSGPYTYGTVIGYTCQTGFQLVGVSSQTCLSSGDWSDEVPYCIVLNCTDPGVPVNGGQLGSDFTNGSVLNFTCNEGYALQGSESIYCYHGNWSAPVPQCVVTTLSSTLSTVSATCKQAFQIIDHYGIPLLFVKFWYLGNCDISSFSSNVNSGLIIGLTITSTVSVLLAIINVVLICLLCRKKAKNTGNR